MPLEIKALTGIDEVGRGPLAGPVVAAAVVLQLDMHIEGVKDSKRLSERRRRQLSDTIRRQASGWSIGAATAREVDVYNVHRASMVAMRRALHGLSVEPNYVYVDGNSYPDVICPGEAVVRGDQSIHVISAASILAKVARDQIMRSLSLKYPGYGFEIHKGYPTPAHLNALRLLGPCAIHRRTYRPVKVLLEGVD